MGNRGTPRLVVRARCSVLGESAPRATRCAGHAAGRLRRWHQEQHRGLRRQRSRRGHVRGCGRAGWIGTLACSATCTFDVAACNTPATTFTASYTDSANWAAFDLTTLNANAKGFASSAFDGRYLYLVQNYTSIIARLRYASRFRHRRIVDDVRSVDDFADARRASRRRVRRSLHLPRSLRCRHVGAGRALRSAEPERVHERGRVDDVRHDDGRPGAHGYVRAAFDGRYIYYAPYYNGTTYHGVTIAV